MRNQRRLSWKTSSHSPPTASSQAFCSAQWRGLARRACCSPSLGGSCACFNVSRFRVAGLKLAISDVVQVVLEENARHMRDEDHRGMVPRRSSDIRELSLMLLSVGSFDSDPDKYICVLLTTPWRRLRVLFVHCQCGRQSLLKIPVRADRSLE